MTPPFEPGDLVQCTWHTLDDLRTGVVVSAERDRLGVGFWCTVFVGDELVHFDAVSIRRWCP